VIENKKVEEMIEMIRKSENGIKKIGWGFGRCNQHCVHCYNASKPTGPEYTFEQLRKIADKICPQIEDINFGTGEFFFNPNTLDLAEYIKEKYPYVHQALTTNGSTVVMMRPEKIAKLFHDVDVSLDFPSEEKHNTFRGHKKAWQWVHEALIVLQDQRVPRSIVTCVTSQTTNSDIQGLLEIAKKYDANWRINWFRCVGRGTADLRLSAERAWEVIGFLSDKVTFLTLDSIFGAVLGIDSSPCPAGHHTARIHENMDVSAYPFLKGAEWYGGNMLDESVTLQMVYDSPAFQKLRERKVDFCEGCEFQSVCQGGCVTRAALHNGSVNAVDDFCPIAAGIDVEKMRMINIRKGKGDLVHDGYLCTTIVRPD